MIWRKLDCLKPNLQRARIRARRKDVRKPTPVLPRFGGMPRQPSGPGAMPSEGIQGDEWDAYVTLLRTTETNVGSPVGREPQGDGGPVVVAGVATGQGERESRSQGEGGQVIGHYRFGRYAKCKAPKRCWVSCVSADHSRSSHRRAGCFGNGHVRFGGRPCGKGPASAGTSPHGQPCSPG